MTMIKIIIPVYKTEKYLERCVNSIFMQTEQRFQIVLIDDGSPDRCPEICDRYAENDVRVHVIHQVNQGLSAARNAGMNYKLDCNYVTFIDSDDWVHPRYLEVLLNAIQKTGSSLAVGGHIKTNEELQEVDELKGEAVVYSAEECYCLTTISTTPAWGKMYKTEIIQDVRFPVGRIHEDFYTTWKIIFKLKQVAVVAEPLYFYYINPGGIMNSLWSPQRMDFFPALEEKINFFHEHNLSKAEAKAINKLIRTLDKYILLAEKNINTVQYAQKLRQMRKEYDFKYPKRCIQGDL